MDLEDTLKRFAGRIVFIGGGTPVWDAYAISSATTMVRRAAGSILVRRQRVERSTEIKARTDLPRIERLPCAP
jgi:hypothetical protein